MIDRTHALPVTRQAELVGISRGTVYYLPRPVSAAELALMHRIDRLHLEHPFMGARLLRDTLNRQTDAAGARYVTVGRKHVATLMRRMGIEALYRKPGTSKKHPGHTIYPYLLRGLAIERANQVWALDTTYIAMARRFVYLTAVIDVATRRALAWKVAITLETCHAVEVIEEAFRRFGTPEIVNVDQGSQFTAAEFVDSVKSRGCRISIDGRGPGATTCSSSACGARSNTSRSICTPTTPCNRRVRESTGTCIGTTRQGRIQVCRRGRRKRRMLRCYRPLNWRRDQMMTDTHAESPACPQGASQVVDNTRQARVRRPARCPQPKPCGQACRGVDSRQRLHL